MNYAIGDHPSFRGSPYPHRDQPFSTDIDATGAEVHIPKGMGIRDYLKTVYRVTPAHFASNAPFLSRDSKDKDYKPNQADPFVSHGGATLPDLRDLQVKVRLQLSDMATKLEIPLTLDKARKQPVPDPNLFKALEEFDGSEASVKNFDGPVRKFLMRWAGDDEKFRISAAHVLSNFDILNKLTWTRTIYRGWSYVPYSSKPLGHHPAIEAAKATFAAWVRRKASAPGFRETFKRVAAEQGDPMTTNVGYPWSSPDLAIRKQAVVKYAGIGATSAYRSIRTASQLNDYLFDLIAKECYLPTAFAVTPIRRVQPGYKQHHSVRSTQAGLVMDGDSQGENTVRVAHNPSYTTNLQLSRLHSFMKALRKRTVGLFMSGGFKKTLSKRLAARALWILESDFSNYDRFIPAPLADFVVDTIAPLLGEGWEVAAAAAKACFHEHSLLFPDPLPNTLNQGLAVKPSATGLLSGVKLTSEIGTFVNVLIHLIGAHANSRGLDDYVTWLNGDLDDVTGSFSVHPLILIQSDDTLLIGSNPGQATVLARNFVTGCRIAGLKYSLFPGDKFLMKHCYRGVDVPNPMRVLQNSLTQETPVVDPARFLVGLATRSEGCGIARSSDPFDVERNQRWLSAEYLASAEQVFELLRDWYTKAHVPLKQAVEFCSHSITEVRSRARGNPVARGATHQLRLKFVHTLGSILLKRMAEAADGQWDPFSVAGIDDDVMSDMLYDRHSPSGQALLASLTTLDSSIKQSIDAALGKEHSFYLAAMNVLKLPIV